MSRNYRSAWVTLAAVAGLLGTSSSAHAQVGVGVGVGVNAGARVGVNVNVGVTAPGSIRYAPRLLPPLPVIRPPIGLGSVRYGPVVPGGLLPVPLGGPVAVPTPYTAAYVSRFPVGYRTMAYGPHHYYYYPRVPVGATTVVVGPTTYYVSGGVYYQPCFYQGATVYRVVPPPL